MFENKQSSKALVIHSPHAGRADRLSQALWYLRRANVSIAHVISIAMLDSLPAQGANWAADGIDIVVAAGGDGLVGGVITHIAESGPPLGILPLGTANDIARSLNIPQDIQQAAEIIRSGKYIEVDIGVAQPAEQAPHVASARQGKPVAPRVPLNRRAFFAHALTIGLNVAFARLATNVATRQKYGRLTYPMTALQVMTHHTALDMELHFEGLALRPTISGNTLTQQMLPTAPGELPSLCCRALQVTAINAPIFGGMWQLAIAGASLQDRLLDIVVIEEMNLAALEQAVAHLFNQQEPPSPRVMPSSPLQQAELSHIPGIHHVQARGVTIKTAVDPQDVTLDGEVRGQTPQHVSVAEQRLRVVVPN